MTEPGPKRRRIARVAAACFVAQSSVGGAPRAEPIDLSASTVIQSTLQAPVQHYRIHATQGDLVTTTLEAGWPSGMLSVAPDVAGAKAFDRSRLRGEPRRAVLAFSAPADGSYILTVTGPPAAVGLPLSLRMNASSEPPIGPPAAAAGSYALLVGIDDYPGDNVDLRGPTVDVELLNRVLVENFGFPRANVLVLRDKAVTRDRLIRAFRDHLSRAGPDGIALFYYSGHGIQVDEGDVAAVGSLDPEDAGGADEALLLSDGSVVVDDELAALGAGLPAAQYVMILDSCFSGGSSLAAGDEYMASKGVKGVMLEFPYRMPSVYVSAPADSRRSAVDGDLRPGTPDVFIAASGTEEFAWTRLSGWADRRETRPASYFTFFLVEELAKKESADQPIDVVVGRARESTIRAVGQEIPASQTPAIDGPARGEKTKSVLKGGR